MRARAKTSRKTKMVQVMSLAAMRECASRFGQSAKRKSAAMPAVQPPSRTLHA
jgi:hypothetical protein